MPLSQIVLTALSLAAAGGGALGLDRVMDGLCRVPVAEQEAETPFASDDRGEEQRLNY